MATGMVSATVVRAVKSGRKFVPQRAAITLVRDAPVLHIIILIPAIVDVFGCKEGQRVTITEH